MYGTKRKRTIRRMAAVVAAGILLAALPSCDGLLGETTVPNGTTEPGTSATTTAGTTTSALTVPTPAQTTETTAAPATPTPAPTSAELEQWPAESTLPDLYTANAANVLSVAPLEGMTVILDAGHGGQDPGAVAEDVYEKNINIDLAVKTRLLLEMLGATVVMTRSDDAYVSIYGRIAMTGLNVLDRASGLPGFSDEMDAGFYRTDLQGIIEANTGDWDGAMTGRGMHLGFGVHEDVRRLMDLERQFSDTIFVSIHANSALPDTEARGLQVYYSPTAAVYESEVASVIKDRDVDQFGYPVYKAYTFYDDLARAALAGHVYSAVSAQVPELGTGSHAGVLRGNYGVLRENNLAAILVECGYMSNADDRALLLDGSVQSRIAQGIANGVLAYFTEAAG